MDSTTFRVRTGSDKRIVDITPTVADFVRGRGDGLVNVFAPHATAGLALIETGAGSDDDLLAIVDRLLPVDFHYVHQHGSPGHGGDHVMPAFVSPSLMIPVLGGDLTLGTWQSIVLIDPNRDNPERTVRISFLGETG